MDFLYVRGLNPALKIDVSLVSKVLPSYETYDLNDTDRLFIDLRNRDRCFVDTEETTAYLCGYLRDFDLRTDTSIDVHHRAVLNTIRRGEWPLPMHHTGSFSTCIFDKETSSVVLASDAVGVYPLYYYSHQGTFIAASRLSLIAAVVDEAIDEVGVIERMIGKYYYANLGSRTILKNTHRLLPGEWLRVGPDTVEVIERHYDNTLYSNISSEDDKPAHRVWDAIKKEFEYALIGTEQVGLAVSGGLDSRIVLGAIAVDPSKKVRAITFNSNDFYETRVAERCAEAAGASFASYEWYETHFLNSKTFRNYVQDTEAISLAGWLSLLENEKELPDETVFLSGDFYNSLTGKYILQLFKRDVRIKNFFRYLLFGKNVPFTPISESHFVAWKEKVRSEVASAVKKEFRKGWSGSMTLEALQAGALADLEKMFDRIESHKVKYVELLEELFVIYTEGRMTMAKQNLVMRHRFLPYFPIMSMYLIRTAFSVHPTLKINQKLIEEIFRTEPDLDGLSRIPTSQAPFVSNRTNSLIKLSAQGIRSVIDQMLIKVQMRIKRENFRHRVLKSYNWVKPYRQPNARENVCSWFLNDHIQRRETCCKTMSDRAEFRSWPLMSMDILTLGALNVELDIIDKLKCEKKS